MTAHNPATREYAERRTQLVIDHLERDELNTERTTWAARLRSALSAPRTGSLKRWMRERHGDVIETFQINIRLVGTAPAYVNGMWTPGFRQVDARETFVLLGVSRRDYAGMITLASDADFWLGQAAWGDDGVQLVCFVSRRRFTAESITQEVLDDESLGNWRDRLVAATMAGIRAGEANR
jgi:hypothetical protein